MWDGDDEYVDDDHDDNDDDDIDDNDEEGDTRAFLGVSLGKMVYKSFGFEFFFLDFDVGLE